MLNTKHKWAFKYLDQNQEAALLVVSCCQHHRFRNRTVNRRVSNLLLRPHIMVEINETEWLTWHAFKLCPAIEIFVTTNENDHRCIEYRDISHVS